MNNRFLFIIPVLAIIYGCESDITQVPGDTLPFTINVSSATKTVLNPSDLSIGWSEDDELTVIVSSGKGESEYVFTKGPGADDFICADFIPEDGESYTWLVIYPRITDNSTVQEFPASGFYTYSDDNCNVVLPMTGYAMSEGKESPRINMTHNSSVICIKAGNSAGETVTIHSLALESNVPISGKKEILSDGTLGPAVLESGQIKYSLGNCIVLPKDEVRIYVPVMPFSMGPEDELVISLETSSGEKREIRKFESITDFDAGVVRSTYVDAGNGVPLTPETAAIGTYDAVNRGTVVYLYEDGYLLLDDVEQSVPFYNYTTVPFELPVGAADTDDTGTNVMAYHSELQDLFTAETCPALFWSFNRNAPAGTEYETFEDVPEEIISDDRYWHIPSRTELAYVFKQTIHESVNQDGIGFNDFLKANSEMSGNAIDLIPEESGHIYWSATEQQSGSSAGNIIGYATNYLLPDASKNDYAAYKYSHSGGIARCVKKVYFE